jgi:hypothetical protein
MQCIVAPNPEEEEEEAEEEEEEDQEEEEEQEEEVKRGEREGVHSSNRRPTKHARVSACSMRFVLYCIPVASIFVGA